MSFYNVSVRFLAIFIKFLSLGLISRGLEIELLDIYFLFVSVAAFLSPLIGFQTFHISLRRFNKELDISVIDLQIYQYISTFILIFFVCGMFYESLLNFSKGYFFILIFLIFSETLATELSRIFIIVNRAIHSNFVVLINSLSYLFFGFLVFFYEVNNLNIWLYAIVLSILVMIFYFYLLIRKLDLLSFSVRFNFQKIIELIYSSKIYFLSQLLNMLILYSSRYFLEESAKQGLLSYFSILFAFSNIVSVFVTTGIIAPRSSNYMTNKSHGLSSLIKMVVIFGVLASFVLFVFYDLIVWFVGTDALLSYRFEFLLLLLAFIIISVSQVYQLYFLKRGMDSANLISYILSAFSAVGLYYLLIPKYELLGAAIAFLFSSVTMLFSRVLLRNFYRFQYEKN